MYTEGIRKIFSPKSASTISEAIWQAESCNYTLLLFNGWVHIKIKDSNGQTGWHNTSLNVYDFEAK